MLPFSNLLIYMHIIKSRYKKIFMTQCHPLRSIESHSGTHRQVPTEPDVMASLHPCIIRVYTLRFHEIARWTKPPIALSLIF